MTTPASMPLYLATAIIDNGNGIPENLISKVAQENFTFGKENGTGHGLFQVSNLIKRQGGRFKINSTVGIGTMVDLSFPVEKIKYQKIIHIDDQPLIRKAWVKYFSEIGIEVCSYTSPSDYIKNKNLNFADSPVFIDSNMGDEEKGELFAKKLNIEGYSKIYLSSGDFTSIKLTDFPWLCGAFGKRPEFALKFLI